ncbi:helix-turn-helix domain-containing protein [Gordonia sp. DT30]|uniref:helix-turn-helix domain-containing protein n=1 Tax=Gordonia sp. DT30 TaxID=3416546 RepID=UPI003CE7E0F5
MPNPKNTNTKMVTVNEAAEMLGVHRNTIRTWIASGAIRAQRLGPRMIRIRVADIEAVIQPVGGAA